jgi:uncharacterized protein YndB with AHSA1/START domain
MNLTHTRSFLAVCIAASITTACSCSTVRQLRDPATLPLDGKATRVKENGALAYSVATKIAAPPEEVWRVLADAPAYTSWSSTVIKLEGTIAQGQRIKLQAKVAPDRTFDLAVSELKPNSRMVWEDGMPMGMFSGVRTFTLTPQADGSTAFTMAEVFSGGMLGMIEGSLPDFTSDFEHFAADLKKRAETRSN